MLLKMIRGVLFHQRGKMMLIAFTIALGASLATGMLNVMMDVGDKVNQELKTYGANITVKPKDASLLSDIYDIGENGEAITASYLREEDLGKIKTIFWAFNIVDFTPFLTTEATLPDGTSALLTGSWFNHHLSLPTGEELDAGLADMRVPA
jgi:putative ABC transport system permease protein